MQCENLNIPAHLVKTICEVFQIVNHVYAFLSIHVIAMQHLNDNQPFANKSIFIIFLMDWNINFTKE